MSDSPDLAVYEAPAMRIAGAQRPLVLAARGAARAMHRRALPDMLQRLLSKRKWAAGASAWRRPGWMPLLLRWARRAVPVCGSAAGRAPALPASPAARFHWHFHLAALPGPGGGRRTARAAAAAGPFRARVPASGMQPVGAHREAGAHRLLSGPTGTAAGARAIPAHPPRACAGRTSFAAHAAPTQAGAWKVPPAPGTVRTFYERRWFERDAAQLRWLRAQADIRAAPAPHARAAHPFLTRGHLPPVQPPARRAHLQAVGTSITSHPLPGARSVTAPVFPQPGAHPAPARGHRQPGALSFGQARARGGNAAGGSVRPSASMRARPPMEAPAAMAPPMRSMYAQMHTGSGDFVRQRRSQPERALPWPEREHSAARASGSPRPALAWRRPAGHAWNASERAAGAAHSPGHAAAPRTLPDIGMPRPVDLVWLTGPANSAAPASTAHARAAATALAASTQSMHAAAQPSAASDRSSDNAVVRATELDPALANRLADEVIRRIDRRARIQRERRGL